MNKSVLALLSLALVTIGCEARMEVAKDNVLAQVDSLLGEIEVKKKSVDLAIGRLTSGISQLKKGRIEAKARVAAYDSQIEGLESKVAEADEALLRLREHLKAEKDVEISGKTFSQADLKRMAETTISARKKLVSEIEALKTSRSRLDAVAVSLASKEQEGAEKVGELKRQLDEIETKAFALKSIKDASQISGESMPLDFETVEKDVRDLSIAIDTQLGVQEELWDEAQDDLDAATLQSVIADTATAEDTVAEIDAILGK